MPMRQNPLIYPAGFSPGFDPSHAASRRGPVLFSVANLGSGFVNLLNGKATAKVGSPTQLIVKGSGPSSKMAANADGYTFPVSTATPSAQTLAAVATFDSFTSFAGILAASGNSGYLASSADGGHLKVLGADVVLNGTMVTGRPYFVVAAISTPGKFVTVRDLITGAIYTGSDVGQTPNAPSGTGYVGANNGLVAGCTISAAMAVSGALNTAEQLAWARDPWAFWYPSASVTKLSSQVGVAAGGNIFAVAVTEAGTATDTETVIAIFAAAGSETGIAVDANSVTAIFAATDTEAGSAADVTTGGNSTPAAITESGAATDAETVTATFAPSVTEAGSASDTDVATAVFVASETEAASASDSLSASAVFAASDTEAASATDSENTQNQGSVTEAATAAETESATVVFAADISEPGTATDTSSNTAIFVAVTSESGTADDVTSGTAVFAVSDTEAAAATDLSNAAIPGPPSTDAVHGNPFFATPGPMTTIP